MTRQRKVYLSGPMTGLPGFNYPAFNAAATDLRARGYFVFNPAETDDGDTSKPRAYYMRKDIEALLKTDLIVLLPRWRQSRGALLEAAIATELDLPLLTYPDMTPTETPPETILAEAERLVYGPRQSTYGHPLDDFTRTGRIWAAILDLEDVTAEQVALCMVAVKLSRECNAPNRDNRVDGAGYWACCDRVHRERERREDG